MKLVDIPIRTKLPFTMAFILLLLAVVMLLFTLIINRSNGEFQSLLSMEVKSEIESQGILIHTLQARRAEKDFLLEHRPDALATVQRELQTAREKARQIGELDHAEPQAGKASLREKCTAIQERLQRYGEAFALVVRARETMGLDEKSGLEGQFRQAAHGVETLTAQYNGEMKNEYLALRRQEKDYLLRREGSYVQKVEEALARLRARAEKVPEAARAEFLTHLKGYDDAFHALAAQQTVVVTQIAALREAVHPVETLAREIQEESSAAAARSSGEILDNASRLNRMILYVSILAILVCGLLGMTIVFSLTRSLSDLTRYSREVASGNLEASTQVSGRDEVGQLAAMMREMVHATRAIRLIADRMVLIITLVSHGHIPEKIETSFQGDLKKIGEAVNGLIDWLRELRTIADHLHQLSEGQVPGRIQGRFEGDFRRLAESANLLIDRLRHLPGQEAQSGSGASPDVS